MHQKYLRLQDVRKLCGDVSKATVYRWMHDYGFPKPIKLGPNTVAWISDEVQQYLQDREQESRA